MNTEKLEQLHERMLKEFLKINPGVGTAVGLHDPYDRLLPHGGRKRLDDTLALLEGWNATARRQAASQELSGEDNLHLDLLSMSTDIMRFATDEYPLWKMYPDCLESIGGLLFLMASRDYAPPMARAKDITCRLRLIPDHLKQFRTRFDPGEPVRLWTDMAIESCDNFPGLLDFVKDTFKDCSHEHRDLVDAAQALGPSNAEHMEWLKQLLDRSSEDFSMGRERFAKLLEIRKIEMSVDEILALGRDRLEKLKQERVRLADRIAPGKGVDEAVRISRNTAPKTFEQALEKTREEMESAKGFIIKSGIATIDSEAELGVVETPAFLAAMLPYAALSMSSKFDPVPKGEYLVTRPKDSNDLGSHFNEGSIINTAVHEAYPGHFHQGVRSNRKHWMLQFNTMIISSDTFDSGTETCEGWAHYCEKMMFESGYRATDLAAFEMTNGALWRAYRVIADIGLACGEASFEDMVDLGIKEARIPRNASEAEVKRYTHTPGQALSYLLGRELLIGFREEMETNMGNGFDERRFHDLVADYGELPFSLMRDRVREGLSKR